MKYDKNIITDVIMTYIDIWRRTHFITK